MGAVEMGASRVMPECQSDVYFLAERRRTTDVPQNDPVPVSPVPPRSLRLDTLAVTRLERRNVPGFTPLATRQRLPGDEVGVTLQSRRPDPQTLAVQRGA